MNNIKWMKIPDKPSLQKKHVHIFKTAFNLHDDNIQFLEKCLSSSEKKRVSEFFNESDRKNSIISRSILKFILSRYLDRSFCDINLSLTSYGKPFLKSRENPTDIRFNLSHSGKYLLIALAPGKNIGIDVQKPESLISCNEIADEFFSEFEKKLYHFSPIEQKQAQFYRLWCAKEAYVKALGKGLSLRLNEFSIDINRNLLLNENLQIMTEWSLKKIKFEDDYFSYLAINDTDCFYSFYFIMPDDYLFCKI